MTVGLPGSGIGGLFYLVAAVLLPIRAVLARAPLGLALRLVAMAGAIFASMWATGWFLGLFFGPLSMDPLGSHEMFFHTHRGNLIRWAMVIASYATLAVVFLSVHVARFFVGRRTIPLLEAPAALIDALPRAPADDEVEAAA